MHSLAANMPSTTDYYGTLFVIAGTVLAVIGLLTTDLPRWTRYVTAAGAIAAAVGTAVASNQVFSYVPGHWLAIVVTTLVAAVLLVVLWRACQVVGQREKQQGQPGNENKN